MNYDTDKLRKLKELNDKGIDAFPYSFDKNISVDEILKKYNKLKEEESVKDSYNIAGRIMQLRRMGKVTFIHLEDETGKMQLYFRQDDLGNQKYNLLKKYDIGDIIGVKGEIFKTKTGELSVYVREHHILCKSLNVLPEKYHGLQDKELRYRKRYLDLIMNRDVKEVFIKRAKIIKAIRDFMYEKGYMEVETPLLQTQYGGANARPFLTHINAWNMPMYLSISPELYLKRLIVGGYEKVFTICKNFRNEGVDFKHNPEFTMLEAYSAYQDYNDMMKLLEECYEYVALKINGTTKVKHNIDGKEIEIDFKSPWPRMTCIEIIKKHIKIDVDKMDVKELSKFAKENKLEFGKNPSWGDLVSLIFDELVESKIIQPTHIYDRPKENSPLCKIHRKDKRLIEQNEPIGLGMELGNMYSELNNPIEQEKLFNEQVEKGRGGFEESHPMDEDFLECLSYGMPPTGGIGWGVDRMAILLTGVSSIRDIILFPTMKPKVKEETENKK